MIVIRHKGDFHKTENFLEHSYNSDYLKVLERFGSEGVRALASATPVDSGKTASSWDYEIRRTANGATISWTNSNVVDGVPIAIILQYGHGTRYGAFVEGRDYINPAIQPIFDKIAKEVWKEVVRL